MQDANVDSSAAVDEVAFDAERVETWCCIHLTLTEISILWLFYYSCWFSLDILKGVYLQCIFGILTMASLGSFSSRKPEMDPRPSRDAGIPSTSLKYK